MSGSRICPGPPSWPCPTRQLVPARHGHKQATRCAACAAITQREKRAGRGYTAAYVRHVNVARAAWITAHGYTCAGCRYSNHQPHSCTRDNPLTMDHLHPIGAGGDPLGPLIGRCRRGNGARGARPDPVR